MRRLDYGLSAALLLTHAACSASADGPPVLTAARQDAELRRSAERILAREPQLSVSARNVAITVRGHIVSLSGSVATPSEKERVEGALRVLPAAASVSSAIDAAPQRDLDDAESDRTIVEAIRGTIASDSLLAPTAPMLRIEAHHGVARIDGWVPDRGVERAIETVAEETPGVIAVDNDLAIGH
jgi:osmotically-inducible protein OsmY